MWTLRMAMPFKQADSKAFNDKHGPKPAERNRIPELERVHACQSDTKKCSCCIKGIPKALSPDLATRPRSHTEYVACSNYSQAGYRIGCVSQEPPSDSDEYYSLDEHHIPEEEYNVSSSHVKKLTKKRESSSGKGCIPCKNVDSSSEDEYFVASAERPKKKKKRNGRSFSDYISQSEESDTDIKKSYYEDNPTPIKQEEEDHNLGTISKQHPRVQNGNLGDVANDSNDIDETNSKFATAGNDTFNCNKEDAEAGRSKDDVEVVGEQNRLLNVQDSRSSNKIDAEDAQPPQTIKEEDEQGCESSDLPRFNTDVILGGDVNVMKQTDSSAIRSSDQSLQPQINHDEDSHTIEVACEDETAKPLNDVGVVDKPNKVIKRRRAIRKRHTDEYDDLENRPHRKAPPGPQTRHGSCNSISSRLKRLFAEDAVAEELPSSNECLVSSHETGNIRSCQSLPASVKENEIQDSSDARWIRGLASSTEWEVQLPNVYLTGPAAAEEPKNNRSLRNGTENAIHMPFRMVIWLALLVETTTKMARSSFGSVSACHLRLCEGIQAVEEYIPGILKNLEKMSKPERHQWMEKVMAYMAARIAGKRSRKQGCCRKRKWKTTSDESFKAMLKRRRKEVLRNNQTTEVDERMIINEGYIQEQPEIQLMQPPTGKPSQPNYQDESQRVNSFRGCPELHRRAHDLASSGFYLTTYNIVKCSSCQRQRHMRELGEDSSSWHFPTCRFRNLRTARRQGQTSHGLDVVVADTPGRVSDEIGDPPGQQSVYIPPGDVRNETYRLSTFEHFPVTCPISRKSLAKSGFYFTGFFDRVKCFACGRTVERWEARDNPAELRWHKPDCPFPRGDPCGNIPINDLFNRLHTNPMTRQQQAQQQQEQVLTQTDPNTGAVIRTVRYPTDLPERIRRTGGTFEIGPGNAVIIQSGPGSRPNPAIHIGNETAPPPPRRWRMANVVSADHRRFLSNLYLNRELDRLTSFARWPVSRPNVAPAALARTGFFYLGDMDRTQCFSCGGVLRNWTLEDDAQEEHRTHFPSCALVQGTENRNVAIPEEPESPEDRNRHYPCRYPANPHMRSEAARLETFDHRWPAGRVEASAALIAQAGFFFLGERDRVKCWYCNGGLQNWEYDDMPWIEHAKWFPNCQFLLQNQGQVFVYRHLAMNPHLARPIIAKQEGATVDPAGGEVARGQDIPPGPNVRQPSPPPTIIDPQEEMRKKKEKIENIMKTSDVCKNVIAMGFSVNVVRRLLEERVEAGTEANQEDIYESASALLDDVMKKEEEMQREAEEEEARNQANLMSSMQSAYSTNLSSLGAASLGPAPGSGRYNVSFYDDDEPMDDEELYGSMNGPTSVSSVASASSVTAAKQVQQKDESQESLQEQLQKIEEERMCKICFSNTADMVFIPCSHMICCMDCTQAIRQCPVCRTKIEKAIKTYVN